ncbi:MAG: hypothetical protein K2W96_01080 [Gemmataceae bacterium]|nr:hypothetical protein [Gemmataceae bacterium]
MSTMTEPVVEIEPGAEAHAESRGVGDVFRHILASVPRLFPTFRSLRVSIEPDPEIRDHVFIIFRLRLARSDVPDRRAAWRRWYDDYREASPIHREPFVLDLLGEPE